MQQSQPKHKHTWVRVALSTALVSAVVTGTLGVSMGRNQVVAKAATTDTIPSSAITNFRYGPLNVNQALWNNVPYFVAQKTTFFGIWYLQQLLKEEGITTEWDGHSLIINNLPNVDANAIVDVNGKALSQGGTVSLNGNTYVDASSVLQALGGSASYDASSKTLAISYESKTTTNNGAVKISITGGGSGSTSGSNASTSGSGSTSGSNASTSGSGSGSGSTTSSGGADTSSSSTSFGGVPSASGSTSTPANINLPTTSGGGLTPSSSVVQSAEKKLNRTTGDVFVGSSLWKTAPILVHGGTTYFGVWYLQQLLRNHGINAVWDGKSLSLTDMPQLVTGVTVKVGTSGTTTSTGSGAASGSSAATGSSTSTGSGASSASSSAASSASIAQGALIQYNGHTLIPVSVLQQLGVQVTQEVGGAVHLSTGGTTVQGNLMVNGVLQSASGTPLTGQIAIQDADGTVQLFATSSSGHFSGQVPGLGSSLIGVKTSDLGWIGQATPITPANATNLTAVANQGMVTMHGKVTFPAGKSYKVVQVSVRNVITHAHYYANVASDGTFTVTVPVGSYESFALVTENDAVFVLQSFLASPDSSTITIKAPALPTGKQVSSAHAVVSTADSNVTPDELVSVDNIFEHVYQETVQSEGIKPTQQMDIHLYGSSKSYAQHYVNEGYSQTESQQISEMSVASEEGTNTINILMPTFDTVDGLNILAHELTHALTAEVSTQIPSWANEGGAWTQGINAEADQSPSVMLKQGIQWNEWVDIVAHQANNSLLPLGGASTLSGNYNIEAQDYFAVTQLVDKYGWSKFMQYVRAIDHDKNAFADTFGESFSTFSQQVTAVLKKDAAASSNGFTVKLRTLPNGPHEIYFINSAGSHFLVDGLEGNQTYTFTCNPDGTVTAPAGLTVTSVSSIPVAISGDWFVGSGGTSSQDRQEFDIVDEYGLPFLDQAILYDSSGNVDHVYPATAIPNGIQLISITAGTQ